MTGGFCELRSAGLIAASGPDATAFLQAQLTSDVAGLAPLRTQYSGYCTPQGRLLATFLLWRRDEDFLLQLPDALCEAIRARLEKYVLRARVQLAPATVAFRLFGIWGSEARSVVAELVGDVPQRAHEMVQRDRLILTRLPVDRFLLVAPADIAETARTTLAEACVEHPESVWSRLEIEAGVPIVLPETQEHYVPQMLNFDLIGAVSYNKGCYPGQEIVARTHYLGRLKQRMYRFRLQGSIPPAPGDRVYSAAFGDDQASGAILYAAPAIGEGYEALAVMQANVVEAAADRPRWKSPDGPALELMPLPYPIPA